MKKVNLIIVPRLPKEELYDLVSQLRRASKAPIAIIAEGYSKRHHKRSWLKYISDAIGECNEMMVHLSVCRDIYSKHVDAAICDNLIKVYDLSGKQLYCLGKKWK